MKNIINNLLKAFAILLFVGASYTVSAQPPPPPGGSGGGGGTQGEKLGGNAPIGGGLFILLGMGLAYGGKKMYDIRSKEEDIA